MISVREEYCPKNHRCPTVSYCPAGAINQKSPYSAPTVDQELCTDCGRCLQACSVFVKG